MRLPIVIGRRQYRHWPGSNIRLEKQLPFRHALAVPAPAEVVWFNKLPTCSNQARSARSARAGVQAADFLGYRTSRARNAEHETEIHR